MNTPILETSRLILRKFTERDMEALFLILKDEEANKFLPWYPVKDLEETRRFYQERYAAKYGLRKEFWHRGIATEAGGAVIAQVRKDGLPYITATHDRNNPRSGNVMRKLGMTYRYSYEELWQPKNFPVIFRMYQLNLNGDNEFVYRKYWDEATNHFVEDL